MRYRTFTLAALIASAVVAAHPPALTAATQIARLAPADEYFGRLKMSILGIRNRITEVEHESADPALNHRSLMWKLSMVDDALIDWHSKYPADPWIARFRARLGTIRARISSHR